MNKNEAIMCAEIAQATYTNKINVKGFRMTATFENKGTDTQGFFGELNDDAFVVAFRGSEETGLADWITDAKFVQSDFPFSKGQAAGAKAHQGFISAYQSVRETILKVVQETSRPRIITIGHSLGGALAILCTFDIRCNVDGKTVDCYTFGAPKVGNDKFAAACQKLAPNIFRFVNGVDVVPSIPPGDYEHVGYLYSCGEKTGGSFSFSEIVDNLLDKMTDHLPQNYVKALKALVD